MNKQGFFAVALGISVSVVSHATTVPSVEDFAARPRVEDASISPDGHYIAQIETQDGRGLAVVTERGSSPQSVPHLVMSEPDHFHITWSKPHRFVTFPDADHQFSVEKNRATMLREIAAFLDEHLSPAAPHDN